MSYFSNTVKSSWRVVKELPLPISEIKQCILCTRSDRGWWPVVVELISYPPTRIVRIPVLWEVICKYGVRNTNTPFESWSVKEQPIEPSLLKWVMYETEQGHLVVKVTIQ